MTRSKGFWIIARAFVVGPFIGSLVFLLLGSWADRCPGPCPSVEPEPSRISLYSGIVLFVYATALALGLPLCAVFRALKRFRSSYFFYAYTIAGLLLGEVLSFATHVFLPSLIAGAVMGASFWILLSPMDGAWKRR